MFLKLFWGAVAGSSYQGNVFLNSVCILFFFFPFPKKTYISIVVEKLFLRGVIVVLCRHFIVLTKISICFCFYSGSFYSVMYAKGRELP